MYRFNGRARFADERAKVSPPAARPRGAAD